MNIEIYPAEKTCEQGCSIYPLARKERLTAAASINEDVQNTFSLLEVLLKKNKVNYTLHYPAVFNLFPKLNYPELIEMARFETMKGFDPKVYSSDLQRLLKDNRVKPKTLGFSIVPEFPIISEMEKGLLKETISELQSWHSLTRKRSMAVTIRSNLIPLLFLSKIKEKLIAVDNLYLKSLVKERPEIVHSRRGRLEYELPGGYVYWNECKGKTKSGNLDISNRVMGWIKLSKEEAPKIYFEQAVKQYNSVKYAKNIVIAPQGVMLMHTSLYINNPILWMSHYDFRSQLKSAWEKDEFSSVNLIKDLIQQNASMYNWSVNNKDDFQLLFKEDYQLLFYDYRPLIKKRPVKK